MTSAHPTTPIAAQLEKLLGAAGGPALAPAAAAPADSTAMPAGTASSATGGDNGGAAAVGGTASDPSDPIAALDNLFAARFTFQFDNLQHILRYMLGEMRTHKRAAAEVERLGQRVAAMEARDDSTAQLHQQAGVCRKHNTQVAATLTRIEERASKESALVGRRLASLEVGADKRDAQLAAHAEQIESIVTAVRSGAGAGAAPGSKSAAPLSTLPSPALTNAAASRRGVAEVEGLSSQISKFMLTHTHGASVMAEKVRALEDAEAAAKRVQEDLQAHISFLHNENKRLTEKIGRMEDEMDRAKMNPNLTASTSASASASAPAASAALSAPAAAEQDAQRPPSSMAPSSHGPTGSLPLPASAKAALGASDSTSSIDIAVDRHGSQDPRARLTPSSSGADLSLSRLSESDMGALQSRLENGLVHKVALLRAELEQRWSVEKEAAREHRHAIIDAVQQAAESALEARSAVNEAQRLADDAVASVVRAAEQGTGAALLQGSLDASSHMADSAAAGLMFAGQEQVTTVAAGGRTLSSTPVRGSRALSDQSAAAAAANAAAAAAAAQASIGHIKEPKPLRASQAEFDRVRAMAELALRRTVQHSEVLALAESSPNFQRGVGFGSGGGGGGGGGGVSVLDFDKLKASTSNMGSRVLFVEDKVETLNALTLATRNQLLALAADVDNSPVVKSLSMRLFEQELRFAEVTDKVQLLAHLLSKGGVPGGSGAGGGDNGSAHRGPGAGKGPNHATHTRSLVSAMAAEDAVAARQGLGPLVRDDDDNDADMAPSRQPATPASASASTRPRPHDDAVAQPHAGEVSTAGYTDPVDTEAATLGMVLRTGAGGVVGGGGGVGGGGAGKAGTGSGGDSASSSMERMAKDLAALGSMHEKLASAAALDAKLRQIEVLESKVAALIDLDFPERLTFIERRFNTELTFLRSHVNSKVDASSLKILLDKIELEQQHSTAALQAAQAAMLAAQADVSHSRHAAHVSPTRGRAGRAPAGDASAAGGGGGVDTAGAPTDDVHTPSKGGVGGASGGKVDPLTASPGLMSRSTARDSRSRVGSEIESRARDRKARMAHLLTMLEKKADAGAIRSLEEFVRSVDRHLRSMMQNHAAQIRQLHAASERGGGGGGGGNGGNGGGGSKLNARSHILTAPSIPRKMTVPGYDEPELHTGSGGGGRAGRSGAPRPGRGSHGASDDEGAEVLSDEDDLAGRRRPVHLIHPKHALLSEEEPVSSGSGRGTTGVGAEEEEDDAVRMGFRVGGTAGQVAALKHRCEELQGQIASLHAALARKQDRVEGPMPPGSALSSSRPMSVSGGLQLLDRESNPSVTGVGGVSLSLDGLTLNPQLSLLEHPHVSRLGTRLAAVESDLTHAQSLCMYQSKQLRNHREWIAKHSREINAIKEFVKHAQGNQAVNAAAMGVEAQQQQPPAGSQSARPSHSGHGGGGELALGIGAAAAAAAASSSYPSPAVFQLLRQVESDISSLRRSLRNKVDFADLGIVHPSDPSQALGAPVAPGVHYPHPTLEDLRRLLFYLTPQLQQGGHAGGVGSFGAGMFGTAGAAGAFGHGHESKGSMLSTRGSSMPPIPGADGHGHTHGPGHPDTWKCMACDRALESGSQGQSRSNSRHTGLTSSLSSIAPAGGLVGANTRRLIAATNPHALFNSTLARGSGGANANMAVGTAGALTPRPPAPPAAAATKDKRKGSSGGGGGAIPTSSAVPQGESPESRVARQHEEAVAAAADKAMRKAEKKRIKAEGKARAAAVADASSDATTSPAAPTSHAASAAAAGQDLRSGAEEQKQ